MPTSRYPRPLTGNVLAALALAALALAGCGEPEVGAPEFPLEEVFHTSEPVLVVPGRRWEVDRDAPGWVFRILASLHVAVSEEAGSALTIRLRADELTSHYRFEIGWDGESLFPEPVAIPAGGLDLAIPPAGMRPGRHVLELKRRYQERRDRHLEARHENVFTEVAFSIGGKRRVLDPDELPRYNYLRDFLAYGVTGVSKQKRAGFLFAGPRAAAVRMAPRRAGRLSVTAENFSSAPARFAVRVGGEAHDVVVEANAAVPLRVAVPAGATTLGFAVEGREDGLFLWGAPWIEQEAGGERTPIVLVTVDTTRRDALAPYNGRADLTPHVAELARRATVFEHAYSSAPWTLPSHASMFTGLYPSRHGVGVSTDRIGAEHVPVARLLADAGYLTAGFAGGDLASYRFGVGRGFHLYRDPERFETQGHVLTRHVEDFLAAFHREPLFLFVNYFDAHGPYRAPRKFRDKVGLAELARGVADQPVWGSLAAGEDEGWRAVARSEAPATPAGLDYLRGAYDSEVAFMDAQLGRLFRALKRYDLFERALIVIVGDHGELLGEGGRFGHSGRLDPELTEVPLIVKWPRQGEGRRIDALVSGVDVFPTLLAAAGLEPPPSDGSPLDPGTGATARRPQVFSEEHASRVHPLNPRLEIASHVYVVQRRDFRQTVWDGGTECQRRDGEAGWREVPCDVDGATVLGRLEKVLAARHRGEVDDAGAVSREVEESLRALGYL